MPTHKESVSNTLSAIDTVVGGRRRTVSAPTMGPLAAVRYGEPVKRDPWVLAKNTSNWTLPEPVLFSMTAAPVAETESTLDFPNPGGRLNIRAKLESAEGTPPGTL
jgi:hypothetical protein